MTMNIYVFLQIMNILCIFCRPGLYPGFFPGSGSGHIFGFAGFRAGPVLITLTQSIHREANIWSGVNQIHQRTNKLPV